VSAIRPLPDTSKSAATVPRTDTGRVVVAVNRRVTDSVALPVGEDDAVQQERTGNVRAGRCAGIGRSAPAAVNHMVNGNQFRSMVIPGYGPSTPDKQIWLWRILFARADVSTRLLGVVRIQEPLLEPSPSARRREPCTMPKA